MAAMFFSLTLWIVGCSVAGPPNNAEITDSANKVKAMQTNGPKTPPEVLSHGIMAGGQKK